MTTRQQKFDNIAIAGASILGIILFIISVTAIKNVDVACSSSIIRNGWVVIMTLGACMLAGGVSFFMCTWGKGQCYGNTASGNTTDVRTMDFYFIAYMVIGLFLIGLTGAMINRYNDLSSEEKKFCDDSEQNKKYVIMVLVIAVLVVVGCIGSIIAINSDKKIPIIDLTGDE